MMRWIFSFVLKFTGKSSMRLIMYLSAKTENSIVERIPEIPSMNNRCSTNKAGSKFPRTLLHVYAKLATSPRTAALLDLVAKSSCLFNFLTPDRSHT